MFRKLLLAATLSLSVLAAANEAAPYTEEAVLRIARTQRSLEPPDVSTRDPKKNLANYLAYCKTLYKKAGYDFPKSLARHYQYINEHDSPFDPRPGASLIMALANNIEQVGDGIAPADRFLDKDFEVVRGPYAEFYKQIQTQKDKEVLDAKNREESRSASQANANAMDNRRKKELEEQKQRFEADGRQREERAIKLKEEDDARRAKILADRDRNNAENAARYGVPNTANKGVEAAKSLLRMFGNSGASKTEKTPAVPAVSSAPTMQRQEAETSKISQAPNENRAATKENVAAAPALTPAQDSTEKSGICLGLDLQVSADQMECLGRKYAEADKKLNAVYKEVFAKLDTAQKKSLRESQRTWIKEKEAKCGALAKEEGTMAMVDAESCTVEMTVQRTQFIQSYKP